MFREKREQGGLFSAATVVPEKKRRRLEGNWAGVFRTRALPLIDEREFAHLYDSENGRPNKAVQTVVGLLVLKEIEDLTDEETLARFEFDLSWQYALDVDLDGAHCCQKALHNFRVKLMASESDALLFTSVTDRILAVLGADTSKQRLTPRTSPTDEPREGRGDRPDHRADASSSSTRCWSEVTWASGCSWSTFSPTRQDRDQIMISRNHGTLDVHRHCADRCVSPRTPGEMGSGQRSYSQAVVSIHDQGR